MTQKKNREAAAAEQVHEQDAYQKLEAFFLENRNMIIGVFAVLVIAIGGYFGYKKLIQEPKELDARNKISVVQEFFAKDSLDLALNGDGINPGALAIAESYKNTATGNLARFYTGAIYLKKQEFDNAINYLEKYKPGTAELKGLTNRMLADAWSEKGDMAKATDLYVKAAELAKSEFYSPAYYKMAGDLMLIQERYADAIQVFEIIKKDYPLSEEGQNIQKEIANAQTKMGK